MVELTSRPDIIYLECYAMEKVLVRHLLFSLHLHNKPSKIELLEKRLRQIDESTLLRLTFIVC